jgi:hypothetical protein
MQRIDRQDAFTGTKEVTAPLRIDPARLESYLKREVTGFAGPLTVRQFKGGQSNPTYLLETPVAPLRAAPQAAGQAAAVGARGRPRVQGDQRAACARLSGRPAR